MARAQKKLGEILVRKNFITPQQLEFALAAQDNDNAKIGRILIGHEALKKRELHQAIAAKFGLKFVDLQKELPDTRLVEKQQRENYFKLNLIPFKRGRGKIIIAATDINEKITNWAAEQYEGMEVEFVITSPFDILWSLQNIFERDDSETARLGLWNQSPNLSAMGIFARSYSKIFIGTIFVLALAFYFAPKQAFDVIFYTCNTIFITAMIFKTFVFAAGLRRPVELELPPENNLPVYTILVPLYREKRTLPALIAALKNIDYPKSKLDVKLVVEADDEMTISGLKELSPPAYMEIIRVPYSIPRTKPKACNYALRYTRGEFLTIYDAEDIPGPLQLRKAVAKFLAADEKLACVQARLDYFNYNESQIARWFTLEYGIWFGAVMRGFARMKMPIPLGGTSNHVRTKTLREVGGWDAFNVTEDADLGMRLAQFGYRTDVIDSVTMEEAAFRPRAWVNQRSRWLKGFIQTYFVCMQNPIKLARKTGLMGFLGFQFFVGLPPLIYLSALPLMAAGYYFPLSNLQYNIAVINFACAALTHIVFALIISRKLFRGKLVLSALTFPFYTLLAILAAYKAVWQLMRNPYHWNKTEHGITKVKHD